MPQPSPEVLQQAVSLLARREHSRRELQGKLRARRYTPEAVEQALVFLHEQGLQSDERFAEACAQTLMGRGYGSLRVAHELRKRGVAEDIADGWARNARDGDHARARDALRRKVTGQQSARERLLRFLEQRGYPRDTARQAVDAALREAEA